MYWKENSNWRTETLEEKKVDEPVVETGGGSSLDYIFMI